MSGVEPEVPCTAFDTTATNERNALFTPPCACPRCAPTPVAADDDGTGTIWVRVDGRPVRHDVRAFELGSTGRNLLG